MRMLGFRPRKGEDKEFFMRRVNTKLQHLKQVHDIMPWDTRYHAAVFTWAGHLARMSKYCPWRETYKVLVCRNWRWMKNRAAANAGSQAHGRRLKTWRWERP
eukprot:204040-Karenia_brevis.AAC.1